MKSLSSLQQFLSGKTANKLKETLRSIHQSVVSKVSSDEKTGAFILLLPCLAGFAIFIIIPMIFSFGLSFFEWNLLSKPEFIGLNNYFDIFTDKEFWIVLKNTLIFAVLNTIFAVGIPIILADILNEKLKFSELFKTVYFIPFITPMTVAALVWCEIFDPHAGLFDFITKSGLLFDTKTALAAVTAVSVIKLIGYNTVIILSGYVTINPSVKEAARIDGANRANIFTKVTLPLLMPVILFTLIITTISSFQVFDLIYLMTGGGPGISTDVIVYRLYKCAFEYFETGKASAIAYVLFAVTAILSVFQYIATKDAGEKT